MGGAALVGVSLAVQPAWPVEWLRIVRSAPHFVAPITRPGGILVLLALLRWRRPEARLLVALACVPQTAATYEALPLFLVPQGVAQTIALSVLTHAMWHMRLWLEGHKFPSFAIYVDTSARLSIALLYLSCLLMVLRRPNATPAEERSRGATTHAPALR